MGAPRDADVRVPLRRLTPRGRLTALPHDSTQLACARAEKGAGGHFVRLARHSLACALLAGASFASSGCASDDGAEALSPQRRDQRQLRTSKYSLRTPLVGSELPHLRLELTGGVHARGGAPPHPARIPRGPVEGRSHRGPSRRPPPSRRPSITRAAPAVSARRRSRPSRRSRGVLPRSRMRPRRWHGRSISAPRSAAASPPAGRRVASSGKTPSPSSVLIRTSLRRRIQCGVEGEPAGHPDLVRRDAALEEVRELLRVLPASPCSSPRKRSVDHAGEDLRACELVATRTSAPTKHRRARSTALPPPRSRKAAALAKDLEDKRLLQALAGDAAGQAEASEGSDWSSPVFVDCVTGGRVSGSPPS